MHLLDLLPLLLLLLHIPDPRLRVHVLCQQLLDLEQWQQLCEELATAL